MVTYSGASGGKAVQECFLTLFGRAGEERACGLGKVLAQVVLCFFNSRSNHL